VEGDRVVTAGDETAIMKALFPTCVLAGLAPTKNGSDTVDVAAGGAVIEGYRYINSGTTSIVPAAGTRKDYLVVQLDITNRTAVLAVHQGTSGAFPSLTRSATVHEIAIASIDNSAGAFTVADKRADFALCGMLDTGWITTGLTAESGWALGTYGYRVKNGVLYLSVPISRTGATITPDSTGNVTGTDPTLFTMPAGYRPSFSCGLASGGNSRGASFIINTDGQVSLSALSNSTALASGHGFVVVGAIPL
jgi:hypothetical protein